MQFGFAPEGAKASIVPFDVLSKELTIVGSWLNPYTYPRAIDALANGTLKIDHLISVRAGLEDLEDCLHKISDQPEDFIKSIIFPNK